jgi:hypothetical protein
LGRYYENTEYPRWAAEAARCYGDFDELDGGWGRSHDVVLDEVESILARKG